MGRPRVQNPRTKITNTRLTEDERAEFEDMAATQGYKNISEYIRFLHSSFIKTVRNKPDSPLIDPRSYPANLLRPFYETDLGEILWGDSRSYLFNLCTPESVDLIMTSPPFGLVRKKSYGNEDAEKYCDWFRPFAEGFHRVLKDTGSLVIDIGGAWMPGQPTRSLYHFKLLIMLVEEYGFHLCQEHYWWNPSKLPSPAEWVNVRRVRVKDAVNTIWWLSKTAYPKANNKRVLQPYSKSMQHLLKNGYRAKRRPSGHDISNKFQKNNGGAVPPNLLAIANTESNGRYLDHCRAENLSIHPARFPSQLPEYFIRFLTDQSDMVVDPFAGSCVTGMVAENLARQWVCCDLSEEYLLGGRARFEPTVQPLVKDRDVRYEISPPCVRPVNEKDEPLFQDGGAHRPTALSRKTPFTPGQSKAMQLEHPTTQISDLSTVPREDV